MREVDSGKNVLVSCIIDFKDKHVWLRQFSLNLNACKVHIEIHAKPSQSN